MNQLRTRLGLHDRTEAGFGVIEVVVAMFIFALVISGAMVAMVSVVQVTRDNRSSQVAANLAAEEIDLSRDVDSLFNLLPASREVTVNGDTFTIARSTEWVSDVGDIECGTAGGALRYKRVNVSVSWANMRDGAVPVESNTVLDSRNRINDPTTGTILVSVLNSSGTGVAGAKVEADPSNIPGNTAQTPTDPIPLTDAEGCAYILKVKPGSYDVTTTKPGGVSSDQTAVTTQENVVVQQGTSVGVGFTNDKAGYITPTFLSNYAGVRTLPDKFDLTLFNSSKTYTVPYNGIEAVFPWAEGYQVVAGKFADATSANDGCLSVDPAKWPTYQDEGGGNKDKRGKKGKTSPQDITYAAARPAAVAPKAGQNLTAPVAMGVVEVTVGPGPAPVIVATSAKARDETGDPGCEIGMTYAFTLEAADIAAGKARLALPYGSWILTNGQPGGPKGPKGPVIGLKDILTLIGGDEPIDKDVVTLDPRVVTP